MDDILLYFFGADFINSKAEQVAQIEVYDFDFFNIIYVFLMWVLAENATEEELTYNGSLKNFNRSILQAVLNDSLASNLLAFLIQTTLLSYFLTFFEMTPFILLFVFYFKTLKKYFFFKASCFLKKLYKFFNIFTSKVLLELKPLKSFLYQLFIIEFVKINFLSKTIKVGFEINFSCVDYLYKLSKKIEYFVYDVLYEILRFFIRTCRYKRRILCIFFFFYSLIFEGFFVHYSNMDVLFLLNLIAIVVFVFVLFYVIWFINFCVIIFSKHFEVFFKYIGYKCCVYVFISYSITYVLLFYFNLEEALLASNFIKDLIFKFFFFIVPCLLKTNLNLS